MYKYFEPDTFTVLNESMATAKPVDEPVPDRVEAPQVQKACLDRN